MIGVCSQADHEQNVASDFTLNKKLTSKSGTLAYLAPEVYEGKGYRSEVDWWSLGVVFYECMYNKVCSAYAFETPDQGLMKHQRPFDARTHEGLSDQIKAAAPKYPRTNPPLETSCTSMMMRLLTRSLDDRLGANGFENFTNHPFFANAGMNFEMLEKKQVEPVFKPSTDKTNFDATYDLEELLLEEAPLEARTKHMKPRAQPKADATPQEKRAAELYRMIEQLFEPFDYTQATFDRLPGASGEEAAVSAQSTLSADSEAGIGIAMGQPLGVTSPDQSRQPSRTPSGNLDLSETGSPPFTTQSSLPAIFDESLPLEDAPPPPVPPTAAHLKSATPAPVPAASALQKRPPNMRQTSNGSSTTSMVSAKSKPKKSFLGILSNKKSRDMTLKKVENGVIGKGARQIVGE